MISKERILLGYLDAVSLVAGQLFLLNANNLFERLNLPTVRDKAEKEFWKAEFVEQVPNDTIKNLQCTTPLLCNSFL